MKRILLIALLLSSVIIYSGCDVSTPDQPELNATQGQLATSKFVAIGNSLTAGFQSAGMVETAQVNSFPNLIAQQLGKSDFQQPLIAEPGIGSTPGQSPLQFVNGELVTEPVANPLALLKNALLSRPYDNLGVPGATLNNVLTATSSANSNGNSFFDMILRNPNFGNTTQLQQAILLNPTLIILWIGNNDALAAATAGGDLTRLTDIAAFTADYTTLLTEIRTKTHAALILANIPYVTDIPFINALDGVVHPVMGVPVVSTIAVVNGVNQVVPVDFNPLPTAELFIPLVTEETGVEHITLPGLAMYEAGVGVPDSAALVAMGFPELSASAIQSGMIANGLNPTGQPLPGAVTLTADEGVAIKAAVDGFNAAIATLAQQFQAPVVDMNTALGTLNSSGIDGMSGKFVLLDPVNTAFSLDGVHPNDAGYAIIANLFIQTINGMLDLAIEPVDVSYYAGQYVGKRISTISVEAAEQVKAIF
ncbi:MAG: SGNH/GDSL hydrolase family protein [Calditrichaeota bacterium]|nr:MAG: SGNH/GDSL hydrolase family protein [Calditrichota bacterium]